MVRFISDRIGIIHGGRVVELCESDRLFEAPYHPYTKSLLSAVPIPDPVAEQNKVQIDYDPSMHQYDDTNICEWIEVEKGHFVLGSKQEIEQWKKEL